MITAVLSLTLRIGAITAIFSVVYGVLFDPYPYKNSDRMVTSSCAIGAARAPCFL